MKYVLFLTANLLAALASAKSYQLTQVEPGSAQVTVLPAGKSPGDAPIIRYAKAHYKVKKTVVTILPDHSTQLTDSIVCQGDHEIPVFDGRNQSGVSLNDEGAPVCNTTVNGKNAQVAVIAAIVLLNTDNFSPTQTKEDIKGFGAVTILRRNPTDEPNISVAVAGSRDLALPGLFLMGETDRYQTVQDSATTFETFQLIVDIQDQQQ